MKNEQLILYAKEYIDKFNPGNIHAYHNNSHMLFVYDMSMKIFDDIFLNSFESEMIKENGRLAIGLAALFHDFNHCGGGSKPDIENIKFALNGFDQFVAFHKIKEELNELYIYQSVVSIITSTEFPYKQISESATLCHIIRDADLLPGIYDGWEDVVRNICKEMNRSIEQWKPIQIKFISNLSYKTKFAQKIYEQKREAVLTGLSTLE